MSKARGIPSIYIRKIVLENKTYSQMKTTSQEYVGTYHSVPQNQHKNLKFNSHNTYEGKLTKIRSQILLRYNICECCRVPNFGDPLQYSLRIERSVRNIPDSVIFALYLLKYFPMDILVHRHEKIPQYKIQVNYNVKAVYEYKCTYLIQNKEKGLHFPP